MLSNVIPFHEYLDIKKFIIELNDSKKLFARLPEDKWKLPENELKDLMAKLEVIKPRDIKIEKRYFSKKNDATIFEVCIHDFLRYGFIKFKNGDISYEQLTSKGY